MYATHLCAHSDTTLTSTNSTCYRYEHPDEHPNTNSIFLYRLYKDCRSQAYPPVVIMKDLGQFRKAFRAIKGLLELIKDFTGIV